MSIIFKYNKTINDLLQLDEYLALNIGSSFQYVSYIQDTQTIIIATELGTFASEEILHQNVTDLIINYVETSSSSNVIQISSTIKLDSLAAYNESLKILSNIDLQSNKIFNVPNPIDGLDLVNKNYVDAISAGLGLNKTNQIFNILVDNSLEFDGSNRLGISSNAFGDGLQGGSGSIISVKSDQSQVTKIGILENLTVSGTLTALSGLSAGNNKIIDVSLPINNNDVSNKQYVDDTINSAAGNGLSVLESVLSVNVDSNSIEIVDNTLRVSSNFISTGLTGGSGNPLSIDINQPTIVSVGTLNELFVSGLLISTNSSNSSSVDSGAIQVSGGMGVSKNMYIGGSIFVANGINLSNKIISNVATPVSSSDGVNKGYVDNVISTAGSGITKVGTAINVYVDNSSLEISLNNQIRISNSALSTGLTGGSGSPISVATHQPQIIQVGSLTNLTVTGTTIISDTTETTDSNTGCLQVSGGMFVAKNVYIGGELTILNIVTAKNKINIIDTTECTNLNTGSFIVKGGVSIAKNVHVGGILNMNNNKIIGLPMPSDNTDAANRAYVDSVLSTPGLGLTKNDTTLSINVDSNSIEIVNNTLRVASTLAGTGLSGGSGLPLSINSAQSQITSVGTLTSLSVNGLITAYSGINANNSKLTNVGTPTSNNDAANKAYVDTNSPTAGLGLIKGVTSVTSLDINVDGTSLEINDNILRISSTALGEGLIGGSGSIITVAPNQPEIISVGTLTSLEVNGTTTFTNTSAATSSISGPNIFLGGVSIAKNVFIGGNVSTFGTLTLTDNATFLSDSIFTGYVTMLNTIDATLPSNGSLVIAGGLGIGKSIAIGDKLYLPHSIKAATKALTKERILCIQNTDSTNVDTTLTIENYASPVDYKSSIKLFNVGSVDSIDNEYMELVSTIESSYIHTVQTGNGTRRDIIINDGIQIKPTGEILCLGTEDCSSITTGAVKITNGGLAVAASAYIGGSIVVGNGIDANSKRITNVANPVDIYDVVNYGSLQTAIQGISAKLSVVVASTIPVNLVDVTPSYEIDGINLTLNDRVLLKNQTNPIENGIYIVTNTGAIRATDLATGYDARGIYVFVDSGTINTATGWINSTPGTDLVGTDPLVFTQFSAAGHITPGNALSKLGDILNVNVDDISMEIFNNVLRIKSSILGTGLDGGSGTTISVNNNLSHVTGLGTVISGIWNATTLDVGYGGTGLTTLPTGRILFGNGIEPIGNSSNFTYNSSRLTVPNITLIDTTTSTSTTTGSLIVGGGVGISGSFYLGGNQNISGNLTVSGNASFSNPIVVSTPTSSTHAATKGYVDLQMGSTAGTGLTKTDGILSVNVEQPQINLIGTLSSLSVSGTTNLNSTNVTNLSINDTTSSISSTTGALIVSGGVGISKSMFVEGIITNLNTTDSSSTTTGAVVVSGGLGISKTLSVGGSTFLGNNLYVGMSAPFYICNTNNSATLATSYALSQGINGDTIVNSAIGQPLRLKIGNVVYQQINSNGIINFYNTTDSTSMSTGALQLAGGVGITKTLNVGGNLNIIGSTTLSTIVVIDTTESSSITTGSLQLAGGIGISKSLYVGNILNVSGLATFNNATFSGIVTILNTTECTSTSSGSCQISGGMAISKSLYVGANLTVIGMSNFQSVVTIPEPINASDAASKSYVDSKVLVAGTGINISGGTINVNNILSNVTSIGILTTLTTSGTINANNTVDTTSSSTGSIITAGGIGCSKNLYVGGNVVCSNIPTMGSHLVNKTYADNLILTAGNGITISSNQINVNTSQPQITSIGILIGLTISGNLSITNTTDSTSNTTGATVISGGLGIAKSLYVGNALNVTGLTTLTGSLTTSGTSTFTNTTDSTSVSTGSVQISGGLGIAKSLYIGLNANCSTLPTSGSHLVNKTYADSLILIAGTGVTISSNQINVNANQSQITSVGTLSGLTSSGIINITDTTDSSSTTTGALKISGGIGVVKNITVGSSVVCGQNTNKGYFFGGDGMNGLATVANTGAFFVNSIISDTILRNTSGNVRIGISSNISNLDVLSTGIVSVNTTTDSTSATSGSLQIKGGMGIAKNLYVGGGKLAIYGSGGLGATSSLDLSSYIPGAGIPSSRIIVTDDGLNSSKIDFQTKNSGSDANPLVTRLSIATNGVINISNTNDSASTTSGALQIAGGVGIAKSLYVGNTLNVMGNSTMSGIAIFTNTIDSTSVTTGSTQISGGLGLAKSLYVGNTLNVAGNSTMSGIAIFTNTIDSTSISTGAVQISGGLSIAKSLFVGSAICLDTASNTPMITRLYDAFTSGIYAGHGRWGCFTELDTIILGAPLLTPSKISFSGFNADSTRVSWMNVMTGTGVVNINTTIDSTSTTSGALQIAGGIGIAKNLYVGGNITVTGNISTGSLTSTGDILTSNLAGTTTTQAANDTLYLGKSSTNNFFIDRRTANPFIFGFNTPRSSGSTSSSVFQIFNNGTNRTKLFEISSVANSGGTDGIYMLPVVNITNTTDSTSSTTGALQIAGGLGVVKNITVGSSVVCGQNTNKGFFFGGDGANGLATAANTGAFFNNVLTGDTILRNTGYGSIRIGTTSLSNLDILTNGNVVINTTTDATSTTTGSLQVTGGASVSKSLWVGGTINGATITNTTITNTNQTLTAFEDQSQAILLSGSLSGSATYTQSNNYVTLTTAVNGQVGTINWTLNPGQSWTAEFEYYYGGGSGADLIGFFVYQNSIPTGYNNNGGFYVIFSEYGVNNSIYIVPPSATTKTDSGVVTIGSYTSFAPANTWNKAVITYRYGVLQVYVNGILRGTYSNVPFSASNKQGTTYMGIVGLTGGLNNSHYTRNIRIEKGLPAISNVYNGLTDIKNSKIWNGTGTTTGGVVTVYPTSDGTASGTALFSSIFFASASVPLDTTTARAVPFCGLKSISSDLKTVTFNVITGTLVSSLNMDSVTFAANGTSVNVFIMGQ